MFWTTNERGNNRTSLFTHLNSGWQRWRAGLLALEDCAKSGSPTLLQLCLRRELLFKSGLDKWAWQRCCAELGKPSTATTAFARSRLPRSLLSAHSVAASVWFVGVTGLSKKWLSGFDSPWLPVFSLLALPDCTKSGSPNLPHHYLL